MKEKIISEFLGTYFLVFAGTGAVVIDQMTKSLTHVGVAITFGLVVMALIYTFGHISGAHFNPAVTIGFLIDRDITKREAMYYIVTQIIAGIAASATVLSLFGNVASLGATLPSGAWSPIIYFGIYPYIFLDVCYSGFCYSWQSSKILRRNRNWCNRRIRSDVWWSN